jgi:hypothetical protein
VSKAVLIWSIKAIKSGIMAAIRITTWLSLQWYTVVLRYFIVHLQ